MVLLSFSTFSLLEAVGGLGAGGGRWKQLPFDFKIGAFTYFAKESNAVISTSLETELIIWFLY